MRVPQVFLYNIRRVYRKEHKGVDAHQNCTGPCVDKVGSITETNSLQHGVLI